LRSAAGDREDEEEQASGSELECGPRTVHGFPGPGADYAAEGAALKNEQAVAREPTIA
jgi:hypothetical protein